MALVKECEATDDTVAASMAKMQKLLPTVQTLLGPSLAEYGFAEDELVAQVIEKHGPDLEACARDLAALTEWDAMLDDLQEMGFGDRSLNKKLMIKHDGSLKRTVKDLVTDGA